MDLPSLAQARILIVDDEEANVHYLERVLEHTGSPAVMSTTDPRQALPLFLAGQPDLVLLDLLMPHLDGFAVMAQLAPHIPTGTYLPILVITADMTPAIKRRALAAGARDFLTKPVDPIEAMLRIGNLIETRALHQQLELQNLTLEEKVRTRTRDLEQAQIEIVERLALAAEYRDDETHQHTQRVGVLAAQLAAALHLPAPEIALLRRAAPLHDIGKLGIPDDLLLKPGKLTPAELDLMRTHTTMGARILSGGHSELVRMAQVIALTHHERWDGTGYPHRRRGEQIPLAGRLVAVADVFDALTHARPYKPPWLRADAVAEIVRQGDRQFDPRVVEAFLAVLEGPDAPAGLEDTAAPAAAPDALTWLLTRRP